MAEDTEYGPWNDINEDFLPVKKETSPKEVEDQSHSGIMTLETLRAEAELIAAALRAEGAKDPKDIDAELFKEIQEKALVVLKLLDFCEYDSPKLKPSERN